MISCKAKVSIILLLLSFNLLSQDILMPYLSQDGQYGLVDKNLKEIVAPQYEEIIWHKKFKLYSVKKDGFWGVLNNKGDLIIEPLLEPFSIHSPFVNNSKDFNAKQPQLYLLKVKESYKDKYAFNPNYKLDEYVTYPLYIYAHDREIHCEKHITLKVKLEKNKYNFLDSVGRPLFKEPVYNGEILSSMFIKIDSSSYKNALFTTSGKQLTPFIYNNITAIHFENYVKADLSLIGDSKEVILNSKGEALFEPTRRIELQNNVVILNDENNSKVYNINKKLLFEKKNCEIKFCSKKDEKYFKYYSNGKMGIINSSGDFVVDTIYKEISPALNNRYIFQDVNNRSGLMDSTFQVELETEYCKIKPALKNCNGYYQVSSSKDDVLYGLIDSVGHLIIPLKYKRFSFCEKMNLLRVTGVDSVGLFKLDGTNVIPMGPGISAYFSNQSIHAFGNEYSLEGELLPSRPLCGKCGTPKNDSLFLKYKDLGYEFTVNIDKKSGRKIWLSKKNNGEKFSIIINDKGEEIIIPHFGFRGKSNSYFAGANGTILMVNKDTYDPEKKSNVRGVINFDGEWVIKPRKQIMKLLGNELIAVRGDDDKDFTIYNRYGVNKSKKEYYFVEKSHGQRLKNNRLLVGELINRKEVSDLLFQLISYDLQQDLGYIIKELNAVSKYSLGFLDSNSKQVIELKYTHAEPFKYTYTTVSGFDMNGNTYSDVIDINGNILLHTMYDKLKIIDRCNSEFLEATQGDKKGIIDFDGNIIIDVSYKKVKYERGIFSSCDTNGMYIHERDTRKKYRVGDSGEKWSINTEYKNIYIVKVTDEFYNSQSYAYSKDWEISPHVKELIQKEEVTILSSRFWPKNFIKVKHKQYKKPYFIELSTGRELRELKKIIYNILE